MAWVVDVVWVIAAAAVVELAGVGTIGDLILALRFDGKVKSNSFCTFNTGLRISIATASAICKIFFDVLLIIFVLFRRISMLGLSPWLFLKWS